MVERYRILRAVDEEDATQQLNEQAEEGYRFISMCVTGEDQSMRYHIVVELELQSEISALAPTTKRLHID